jgi:hypothetical protein
VTLSTQQCFTPGNLRGIWLSLSRTCCRTSGPIPDDLWQHAILQHALLGTSTCAFTCTSAPISVPTAVCERVNVPHPPYDVTNKFYSPRNQLIKENCETFFAHGKVCREGSAGKTDLRDYASVLRLKCRPGFSPKYYPSLKRTVRKCERKAYRITFAAAMRVRVCGVWGDRASKLRCRRVMLALSRAYTPLTAAYKALVAKREWVHDNQQYAVVRRLAALQKILSTYSPPHKQAGAQAPTTAPQNANMEKATSVPDSLVETQAADVASHPVTQPVPQRVLRGVYICGDVGSGKTMLMDLFFRHCTVPRKRRVHFHKFMLEVHQR